MRRLTSAALVVLTIGLTAGGALGDNKPKPPPPRPPSPYPMSADAFRARMDRMIDGMRTACSKQPKCPHDFVESGISQLKIRTLEACRDGIVTQQEARWVLQARPQLPDQPDGPDDNDPDMVTP